MTLFIEWYFIKVLNQSPNNAILLDFIDFLTKPHLINRGVRI